LDVIRKAHPNYSASLGAAGKMFEGIRKREVDEDAIREHIELTSPHLPAFPEILVSKVLGLVAPVIARSPKLMGRWNSFDIQQKFTLLFDWAQTVHISQTILNSDPETLAQDLVLSFTNMRTMTGWMELSRAERNLVRETWAKELVK